MNPASQKPRILVQVTNNFKKMDFPKAKLTKLVKAICNRFTQYEIRNTRYELSIAIVGDDEMRKLNKQFLNRDYTTDVISFDLTDEDNHSQKSFELVVNAEKAIKEAKLRGHSAEAELALYVTHGLLHNLGFDHSTKQKARKMHQAEDEILQQLGFGSVYNNSTTDL